MTTINFTVAVEIEDVETLYARTEIIKRLSARLKSIRCVKNFKIRNNG
jgi:hypothetical protein